MSSDRHLRRSFWVESIRTANPKSTANLIERTHTGDEEALELGRISRPARGHAPGFDSPDALRSNWHASGFPRCDVLPY